MFKSWMKLVVLLLVLTVLYLDLRYAAQTPEYAAPSMFDEARPPEYDLPWRACLQQSLFSLSDLT